MNDALRHGAQIDAAASALEKRVIDWRRDFHRHPELSNREVRTAGVVAEHLRALARVSRLLRDSTICQKLRGTDNADALYALLTDRTESHAA